MVVAGPSRLAGKMCVMTSSVRNIDDVEILTVGGAIAAETTPVLRAVIASTIQRRPQRIILDLSQASVLDAAGIGELVRAYRIIHEGNGQLRVVGSPRHRELLARTRLLDLLGTCGSVADAMASFSPGKG